jgi:hypothetical protein
MAQLDTYLIGGGRYVAIIRPGFYTELYCTLTESIKGQLTQFLLQRGVGWDKSEGMKTKK